MSNGRVADYDRIADRYDRRYDLHAYAGVRDALFSSLDSGTVSAALEVGCGTGHWLAEIRRQYPSAERLFLAGVEPAAGMLSRAQAANPEARLVRARAEALPWGDATFDRVFCVNALHHFADRVRFFHEARRILKPGGALMTLITHQIGPEGRVVGRVLIEEGLQMQRELYLSIVLDRAAGRPVIMSAGTAGGE